VRFLQVTERNGAYQAEVAEAPDPRPAADEVLVRVVASGVNRADLSQIAGRYPPPPGEPSILGLEVSGRVDGTGEAVCALLGGGGYADLVAVPRGQILPAPRSVDLVTAGGIPEAYLTAFLNLVVEAGLEAGQRVLVQAGASGIGLAAIQLAKYLGAAVAATTRTAAKLPAMVAAGADLALVAGAEVPEAIEAAWGPGAVDVVLDPVGATTLADNLRLLATGGRIVVIATMGGARGELDLRLLMSKRARLVGSTLRARPRGEKASLVTRFRQTVWPGFDAGRLGVAVDSTVAPERVGDALTRMRDNRNTGKLLIVWQPLIVEPV
jgi:putative PIG3 family NAD(P)H quinone oxidoreductase